MFWIIAFAIGFGALAALASPRRQHRYYDDGNSRHENEYDYDCGDRGSDCE